MFVTYEDILIKVYVLMALKHNEGELILLILNDINLKRAIKEYNLIENLIDVDKQIQPNSVDITLSGVALTLQPNSEDGLYIDPKYPMDNNISEEFEDYYVLQSGEFRLFASNEKFNMPNGLVGFVQGRSSVARLGIEIEAAGLIDAGFSGTITLEVCNQTRHPIRLYKNMRIGQVHFSRAEKAEKLYCSDRGSKYNEQILPTASRIYEDFK